MSRLITPRALVVVFSFLLVGAIAAPQVAGQAAKEPDTVVLKGSPMGGVKFNHKAHTKDRAGKCETCHHASKPEMKAKAPQQKCMDCHTKAVKAPMKTNTQAAFHAPMAKGGTCITCHMAENGKGKKAPTKCTECHKKENV
jgi:Class III cytochrome C family